MGASRVAVLVDGKLDMTQNTVYSYHVSVQYKQKCTTGASGGNGLYGTCHKKLSKIRRILQKFCTDFIKLPYS